MHYIFRKSDGVHLYTAHRTESFATQWAACMANEGGQESDYITVQSDTEIPDGHLAMLGTDRAIIMFPNPIIVARQKIQNSLAIKLERLGFSLDEISLLGG